MDTTKLIILNWIKHWRVLERFMSGCQDVIIRWKNSGMERGGEEAEEYLQLDGGHGGWIFIIISSVICLIQQTKHCVDHYRTLNLEKKNRRRKNCIVCYLNFVWLSYSIRSAKMKRTNIYGITETFYLVHRKKIKSPKIIKVKKNCL